MSDLKISFEEVHAAQQVVAGAITEMEDLTKQILSQAGLSQAAMQAPAGQVTAETFDGIGGAGRALSEVLTQLQHDLSSIQSQAAEGSDAATSIARSASSAAVASAM
ncbi:hypothetical protein GB931_03635 [Modestobacter sp. I12A-02628]|uniref:Uncharacterized protein n=1 Tax=Goekera deserti TaxID=2497753 RepID=A0A7K3WFF1_9ACTN|nr:hypothetical protein [Goekera deserti]MPQ97030.1 hypothetical protein [Goekera deserti]NDI46654.1 hypothetical protein [Goekera deserti]NEL54223.1 hypothetical protein [Goekera deserti]